MDVAKKIQLALDGVTLNFPHLCGLAESVELHAWNTVPVAAISASGRLLYNPAVFDSISLSDATFVLAHELMHLVWESHARARPEDARLVNVTHDILINGHLKRALNMPVPLGGLEWNHFFPQQYKARFSPDSDISLEEVMRMLREQGYGERKSIPPVWSVKAAASGNLGEALSRALGHTAGHDAVNDMGDLLSGEEEAELFPEKSRGEQQAARERIRHKILEAIGREQIELAADRAAGFKMQGLAEGSARYTLEALRRHHTPPWHFALQQWLENTQPAGRTYARTSRRGETAGEAVRPGAKREGYTLHIVLDTSGSQTGILPRCLGIIGDFCTGMNIPEVRLLQCDTQVTTDEWVYATELDRYEIKGYGGSDMSPAMERLAADPEVERAIVLTDGIIHYPRQTMPYEVLWVLTSGYLFKPPYGQVIRIET